MRCNGMWALMFALCLSCGGDESAEPQRSRRDPLGACNVPGTIDFCDPSCPCAPYFGHCENTAECEAGTQCTAGVDVIYGYESETQICLPTCNTHGQCPDSELCIQGVCRALLCVEKEDCPPGTYCSGAMCFRPQ